MRTSPSDVFRVGISFENIYDLFCFDRDLRALTFSYLAKAEAALKNSVVYAFCEAHREHDAYLERANYVDTRNMLVPKAFRGNKAQEYSKNMAGLMKLLNGKLTDEKRMRPFVRHYLDAYGKVPLWVLQNDLTFGNISHFYQLQRRSVQNAACKIVGTISKRRARIEPHGLLRIFDVLVGYRNICAHDERLYCAEVKGAGYSDMFAEIAKVLPADEMSRFAKGLNELIGSYEGKIGSGVLSQVYLAMGLSVG